MPANPLPVNELFRVKAIFAKIVPRGCSGPGAEPPSRTRSIVVSIDAGDLGDSREKVGAAMLLFSWEAALRFFSESVEIYLEID